MEAVCLGIVVDSLLIEGDCLKKTIFLTSIEALNVVGPGMIWGIWSINI
jgi:hypothetical protein